MIYKQETLGLKEGIALVLLGTIVRFTITSMAEIASCGIQGSWLSVLLNGLGAIYILSIFLIAYFPGRVQAYKPCCLVERLQFPITFGRF